MRSIYFIKILQSLAHDRLVSIPYISNTLEISISLCEKVMYRLRAQQLVTSKQGPTGGYRLTKPFNEIQVGELLPLIPEKDIFYRALATRLKEESIEKLITEMVP